MKGKNTKKEIKKTSDPNAVKSQSSYQSGKTSSSKIEPSPLTKKAK